MTSTPLNRRALLGALALGAAAAAQAQPMVNARVVSATPVYQAVPVAGGHCRPDLRRSGIGTATGAVLGGLIGSQIGDGNGQVVGAVAGAIGGAVLGNMVDQRHGYPGSTCHTHHENRVHGYNVVYEVEGRRYQTHTTHAPGPWLQVPHPGYYGHAADGRRHPYGQVHGRAYGHTVYTPHPAPHPGRGYVHGHGKPHAHPYAPPYGHPYAHPYAHPAHPQQLRQPRHDKPPRHPRQHAQRPPQPWPHGEQYSY